jgi:hypothetical protein
MNVVWQAYTRELARALLRASGHYVSAVGSVEALDECPIRDAISAYQECIHAHGYTQVAMIAPAILYKLCTEDFGDRHPMVPDRTDDLDVLRFAVAGDTAMTCRTSKAAGHSPWGTKVKADHLYNISSWYLPGAAGMKRRTLALVAEALDQYLTKWDAGSFAGEYLSKTMYCRTAPFTNKRGYATHLTAEEADD